MRRRIFSALLAVAMCIGLYTPVSAAETGDSDDAVTQDTLPTEQAFAAASTDTARQIINFNKEWRFEKGENKGADAKNFDDSDWRMLNLPHDYSIENDFDPESPAKSGGGYLDGGPAWYRKTWVVPESMAGKRISVDFGGVYMNSKVYVNGTMVGNYPYGYSPFSYDITDLVVADGMTENVIAVYTNNEQPSSRWYSGSGIYRDVTLTVTEPVHVARYGTYVTTPNLKTEYPGEEPVTVSVDTEVENKSGVSADVTVAHSVYYKGSLADQGSDVAAATFTTGAVTVDSGKTVKVPATFTVSNPTLWQVGVGGMYKVHTEVKVGGVTVDTYDTDFGFRWLDFTKDGFFINGKYTKMKGVCQHHDQGALGAVNNQTALDRQIRILREMGVNSIRSSHNPASRALLNACNEQGIMVMNEAFDTWYSGKNDYDFAQFFDLPCTHPDAEAGQTWQEFDIKNMVHDAKNDPAVIMWSIGNEIGESWDRRGRDTGKQLETWVREVDDSGRGVTQADPIFYNLNEGGYNPANNGDHWQLIDGHDAKGFNYGQYVHYDKIREMNPEWFIYSSETSSSVATRGAFYHPDVDLDHDAGKHRGSMECSDFDNDCVNWGTTFHYALREDAKRKYMGGVFFWTGFDYIGEPAPFAGKNQAKSSYFGAIDTCGFPKESFYLVQSQWFDPKTDPMVRILPHWNWEGDDSILIGGKMPIRIYSNARTVEIIYNGESLGKKSFTYYPETATSMARQDDGSAQENLYLQWLVDYAPGTVEAIAYDENGIEVARDVRTTAGKPAALKMAPEVESQIITADGEDIAYIVVDVVDKDGVFNPQADIPVNFTITGNGRIVGTDNGNPLDWTNMKSTQRSTFNGKALVIVQSTTTAGSFTVTANAAGMPLTSTTVYTTAPNMDESTLLGYDPISVRTLVNEQPTLPQNVTAHYANGTVLEKAVSWDKIPAGDIAKAGYITVKGTVTGAKMGADVTASVEVVAPVGVRPVSVVTQPGVQPKLPGTVFLISSDGSETEFPVAWAVIDSGKLTDGNEFTVAGTLTGSSFGVSAHVRVSSAMGHGVNWALASNGASFEAYVNEANYDPLSHINDGIISYTASPKNGWGNWCGVGVTPHEAETVTCTLAEEHEVRSVTLHFREDGGIYIPTDTLIEYWNGTEWAAVNNQSARAGFRPWEGSEITFDPVTTTKLRATFTRGTQDTTGGKKDCMVLTEFQIFEAVPDAGSSTANLATLKVDGVEVEGFRPAKTIYSVNLPFGAAIPEVSATAADNATVLILPAISNNSAALVQVTSEDGKTTKTYTVQFVERFAAIESATLGLDAEKVVENDIVAIRVNAVLQDGAVVDGDLFTVKYSVLNAGVPARAEVKNGRLYAYRAGEIQLQAEINYGGVKTLSTPLTVSIEADEAVKTIIAYSPVTVATSLTMAPKLPRLVKASFDIGLSQNVVVIWDEIDPAQYARSGNFTVSGRVEGQNLRPTATVYVRDPVAAKNLSMATPVGVAPTLPATVLVYSTDGTSTYSEVTWDAYSQDALKTEGNIQITGKTVLGNLPVTLALRVTKDAEASENYAQLWTGFKYSMAFADYGQQGANVLNNGKVDKWCSWGSPNKETLNVGIVFGKDYPGLRYVDTVNLNVWNDNDMGKIGIKDCVVQAYIPEFTVEDIPDKPNNMLDPSMANHPLNIDVNWVDVENVVLPDTFNYGDNTITFDMVQTYAIRLKLTKNGINGSDYYLSLGEIEAYGKTAVSKTDPTITAVAVDGVAVEAFAPETKEYTVTIPGTEVPTLTGTTGNNASVTVLPAPNIDGKSKVFVTSENGLNTETYTFSFISEAPRHTVTVNGGAAYRAIKTFAIGEELVEKFAEGEGVTVVADAAPESKTFDRWTCEGLELTEEQAAQTSMTFEMPAGNVTLTATYKDSDPADAQAVADAKQLAGTGIQLPYASYADENAKAQAATKSIQEKMTGGVTAMVTYEGGYFTLVLKKGEARTSTVPFDVTVEAPPYTNNNPPSNTTTKTEKNPDGSTTKTVTDKKTGMVTATTTYPDGTKIVATTPKDGKTTIEVTVPEGAGKVTITIPTAGKPKSGEVAVIIHEDGTREVIKTSVATEDGLRVTLTGSAKLEIVDNSKTFPDVPADHWCADAIAFVTSRELFNGGDSGFIPGGEMNRAMFFTVMARLDGQDTTGSENWYSKSMDWAKEAGISDGTNPEAGITRESLAVMLYRYTKAEKTETGLKDFSDANSVSDWAAEAMAWAVESGIITGKSGALDPQGSATRGEVAAMLMRFITTAK